MKSSFQPGVSRVNGIVVDSGRAISFMGEAVRVYGTPWMILDIERCCRELIMEHADVGEDSVGMEVNVKHLAPTLIGTTVEITARLAAVEGRKVTFDVSARDELEPICSGSHMRFVVDVAKTAERLKGKAEKLAAKRR